jgi:ubiquinone/menaquinone biosynthesis C-methylase UbiE
MESVPLIPLNVDVDAKKEPLVETWNKMKSAATMRIVKAVTKQIDRLKFNSPVRILDADPSAYASIAVDVASRDPHANVVVTSESAGVLEKIRSDAVRSALSSAKVCTHDESLEGFQDSSFDIVVCSFGQAFQNSPRDTLKEFHRLLKPEGSLIASISENFAMEHLFHFIVDEMLASGNLEDFTYLGSDSPTYFSKNVEPHSFEKLIADGGFDLAHVDHEIARIVLTDAGYKDDIEGYTVEELAKSGKNRRTALERAKRAFVELTKDQSLVSRDKSGNLVTTLPRQFKIMTATRRFANA